MDWDHRPGEEKVFQLSHGEKYSWEQLQTEIAKCDLICANCHRIRTRERLISLAELAPNKNEMADTWMVTKGGQGRSRA
jgi:hypothetical protein